MSPRRRSIALRSLALVAGLFLLGLAAVELFFISYSGRGRNETFREEEFAALRAIVELVAGGVLIGIAMAPRVLARNSAFLAVSLPLLVLLAWPLAVFVTFGSIVPRSDERRARCETRYLPLVVGTDGVGAVCAVAADRGELDWQGRFESSAPRKLAACFARYDAAVVDAEVMTGAVPGCRRALEDGEIAEDGSVSGGAQAVIEAGRDADQELLDGELGDEEPVPEIHPAGSGDE